MKFKCQNCGSTKYKTNGNMLICTVCGESIDKSEMADVLFKQQASIDAFVAENDKLFSINFNDESLTKEYIEQLISDVKDSLNQQQDENSVALKNGILADLSEQLAKLVPLKENNPDEKDDALDIESKIEKCKDIEDLTEKGNTIRKRIEKSFYKAVFNGKPLFTKVNGKPAISKGDYIDFIDYLLSKGKISSQNASYYKNRVENGQVKKIMKDPLNRFEADVPIRFLATGLNFNEMSKACADWGFLNSCSHAGAEENKDVLKHLMPIENGKKFLIQMCNFYKKKNLID